jgi:itaconyl-CoA hydratase
LGCTGLRFKAPVHLGDTIYAYTEVLAADPSTDHPDAGVVRFKHWGITHDDRVVFEGERIVLVKRRSHWAQEES